MDSETIKGRSHMTKQPSEGCSGSSCNRLEGLGRLPCGGHGVLRLDSDGRPLQHAYAERILSVSGGPRGRLEEDMA